ncbi:LacI family transcriptional regulator [Silvibacterium dinghuense]|uniref:LacI family transcriptional regulator n=1 Tax=Silvibacterium dinghuense TaxID=1560006 RepID=A0A4V1NVH3_9BACT|nr:LacI family transcriptional regulator [Silvibacterium dinghuense]
MDIRDVARSAKVSVATVSRTMNLVPTVDEKLSRRVWQAIEELNFYPNTQARALKSGRSRIFGLILSEITNPFFPELVQGFEESAIKDGYEILITSISHDHSRMELAVRRMLERKVEGVAVMTFGVELPYLDRLAAADIPLVFVDDGPPVPRRTILQVDYATGIRQGVQHLAALGHQRIACISGPPQQLSSRLRYDAFLESMREMDLPIEPELLVKGDHTLQGGAAGARRLLSLQQPPTAVMCSNDLTAIGLLRAASQAHVSVPRDLSVIGFDDIHLADFVSPPLTTVRMSRAALAEAAVGALRSHAEASPDRIAPENARFVSIPTLLTVRRSTGLCAWP